MPRESSESELRLVTPLLGHSPTAWSGDELPRQFRVIRFRKMIVMLAKQAIPLRLIWRVFECGPEASLRLPVEKAILEHFSA